MYIASLCLRVDKLDPTLRRCTFCVQMNLIFLCNIVRLLVTKLRAVNSPDAVQTKSVYSQYRTIVKITPIAINPSLLDWAIWMRSRACLVKIENVVIDSKANSYIAVFYSQLHGEKNAEIARARTHPCLLPFVMPSDAMNSATIAVARCPSLRLSVTFRSCAKIFSPSGSEQKCGKIAIFTTFALTYHPAWLPQGRPQGKQNVVKIAIFTTFAALQVLK